MTEEVTVKIRNREYTIRGSDDREQMVKVASYVNKKMGEISDSSKGLPHDRTAILAALDIAGDYFQLIKEKEVLLAEINNRSQKLLQSLDMVLD